MLILSLVTSGNFYLQIFEIHENGLAVGFLSGIVRYLPWRKIRYCKWSSSDNKLSLQCRFQKFNYKFAVADYHSITENLGRFVKVRNHQGVIVACPPKKDVSQKDSTDANAVGRKTPPSLGFQFDLGTLLLFTLVIASVSGWVAARMNRFHQQLEISRKLGNFGYSVDQEGNDVVRLTFWNVNFIYSKPDDKNFDFLHSLPHLRELSLGGKCITDDGLVQLKNCPELENLDLSYTQITDAGLIHLKDLKHLKVLYLRGTQVTAKGIEELKKALPATDIQTTPPPPVAPPPK
jgi:hypothetical protein